MANNHQPPAFRFLTKVEGSDELKEIGQAWRTNRADIFSVRLDLEDTGENVSFMMVPKKPKPKRVPTTGTQPAA